MTESRIHGNLAPTADESLLKNVPTLTDGSPAEIIPAQAPKACPACSASRTASQTIANPWIYVLGDVDAVIPNLAIEKEIWAAMAQVGTKDLPNEAATQKVLESPSYAYLARNMCYVLRVQEVETYILVPSVPLDYSLLVDAAKYEVSAVIGTRGPIAGPEMCNGLTLPIVVVEMVYNFNKPDLISKMPLPPGTDPTGEAKFRAAASETFEYVSQLVSAGQQDGERALAKILLSDQDFYYTISNAFAQDEQLLSVNLKPVLSVSPVSQIDVVVTTANRKTGMQRSTFARYNTQTKFPFRVFGWQQHLGPSPGQ